MNGQPNLLSTHIGHVIKIARYTAKNPGIPPTTTLTLSCNTCHQVLIDQDRPYLDLVDPIQVLRFCLLEQHETHSLTCDQRNGATHITCQSCNTHILTRESPQDAQARRMQLRTRFHHYLPTDTRWTGALHLNIKEDAEDGALELIEESLGSSEPAEIDRPVHVVLAPVGLLIIGHEDILL